MSNSAIQQSVLKQKQIDVIKDGIVKAEKDGKPIKSQIAVLNENNWLNILTPQALGGAQLSIPDALQIIEHLASTDGSIGWLVANSAIAGWVKGFIQADTVKELANSDKAYLAGSATNGGTVEKTKSGYTINGKWTGVPGMMDAAAFVANCVLTENGTPVKNEDRKQQVISFILLKSELNLSAWNPLGLAATGSQHVEVKQLKVPANRAIMMNGEQATNNARLYQYPYLQLSEAILSVAVAGMAANFTEMAVAMINELKDGNGAPLANDNMVQDTISKHTQKMSDARMKLYYAAELTWQACANQQTIKDTILYKVSAAAQDLTRKSRECVDAIFPFCGVVAMDKTTELNRVWRDVHTASHESLIVFGGV